MVARDFSKWKGIDRATINWNPSIDESKCIGCGLCTTSCGRKVYGFDYDKNKSVVKNPLNCMVGCTTCKVYCPQRAISFPPDEYVKQLIKDNNLISKAKKQLEDNKELYD